MGNIVITCKKENRCSEIHPIPCSTTHFYDKKAYQQNQQNYATSTYLYLLEKAIPTQAVAKVTCDILAYICIFGGACQNSGDSNYQQQDIQNKPN